VGLISRLVCALCGLALAGCYSPYRYSPYSPYYGGGVPMYSPQAVPMQPQFNPTPVYPEGTFPPAGTPGGMLSPTPDPNSGGTFPPSNGGFNPTLPPNYNSGSGLVPDNGYGDPGTLPRSGGTNTFENNSSPFQQDGASFQTGSTGDSISRVQFRPGGEPRELQLTQHQAAPIETAGTASPASAASTETEPAPRKPNPYGYDALGYSWLRGVVDFDEQQKAWILVYNLAPGPRDLYKGQITLIDNGQLKKLQNNQVVLVEGQIDQAVCDAATGKPQYRVTKMYGPLVPKF
jgi:hypothetical protein